MKNKVGNFILAVLFVGGIFLFYKYENQRLLKEKIELWSRFPLINFGDCIKDKIKNVIILDHADPNTHLVVLNVAGNKTVYVESLNEKYITKTGMEGDSIIKECNSDTLIIKKEFTDSIFYYKLLRNQE